MRRTIDWGYDRLASHLHYSQDPRPMGAKRHVLILYNSRAGSRLRADHVGRLEFALRARGLQPERIEDLDQFGVMAADPSVRETLAAVIAAGGDGTAAEAVNRCPPGIPLATLPLGTENLLSRYLRHPRNPEAIADLVTTGTPIPLDSCRAGERVFLLMIGVGFDAEVVRQLATNRRGHITRLSYFKPLLSTLRSYTYPEIRVYCGDGTESPAAPMAIEPIRTRWLFGMNLPVYALNLPFAPDAIGTDGQMDICTFDRGSVFQVARYFVHLCARHHLRLSDVRLHRCRHMRIETEMNERVPYQIDGDPGGFLPVDVVVEPNRFTALVAAKRARAIQRPPGIGPISNGA